jgi:aminoglycoside/choline kinase family phosphotransferase
MNNNFKTKLLALYRSWVGEEAIEIQELPQSGSTRRYYRITGHSRTAIGVFHDDSKENSAFISFTKHFTKSGLPVPEIYAESLSDNIYLIKDLGDLTLFGYLSTVRKDDKVFPSLLTDIYREIIEWLPLFQIPAGKEIDYSLCYPRAAFDRQSMIWDLNYFKYYFLKLAKVPFDEQKLEDDFETLTDFLLEANHNYFMYRDFQSRNIMLLDGKPYFIDYQGGRKGALQYDIASLLFDAKAAIPQKIRNELLAFYLEVLENHLPFDKRKFLKYYYGFVLIRILQAMGAYGFRGYYENKPHFLQSIPFAVQNIKWLLEGNNLTLHLPMLTAVLQEIIETTTFSHYPPAHSNLTVQISSFSYRNDIPRDESGNGGGFLFDCRALPNPGRIEEYMEFSGKDQPVIDFLRKEHEVNDFLNHVFSLIDQSVKKYIGRDFKHLSVSFGCTGGKHRSVYCAEELARHLKSIFPVKIVIQHNELNIESQ